MTTMLAKTKAEQSLAADFAARAEELPGNQIVAAARTKAMEEFTRLGLPHRRVEAWKYTDLRVALKDAAPIATRDKTAVSPSELNAALGPLAALQADRIVFVNGSYNPTLSTAQPQILVPTLGAWLQSKNGEGFGFAVRDEAVVALNAALATDGASIWVKDDLRLDKPVLIVSVAAGLKASLATLRHKVMLDHAASATVIEAHVTLPGAVPAQSNSVLEISVDDAASLTHILVSLEGAASTHLETVIATIGANATYKSFQLTAGTGLARTQSFVTFEGENAKLDISGLMLGRGRDHIDTTLVIDHAVPGCESRELFKAVLDDTARAVFQGKVIVRPHAQKTDGKQMAKALMLSEACEFDSKPELEIYADDVVCGHGATVAEIDPGMMFYLRSRGIPKDEARAMLIESFVGEALEKIDDEGLRAMLSEIARRWLETKQA